MDDRYVVDWGPDGTGYLRPASFGTVIPPTVPPEPPPPTEEDAHEPDTPWAYGQPSGTTGP